MPSSGRLEFFEHGAFKRDVKCLLKNYRTLKDDISVFRQALCLAHETGEHRPEDLGMFPLSGLSVQAKDIYIAKKFACRALKGSGARSGIRVVYRFNRALRRIEFIEIFHKNEKTVEDKDRIEELYSN